MVRRPGDDKKFAGGRAAERLKLFEIQRGLDEAPKPSRRPRHPPSDAGEDENEK